MTYGVFLDFFFPLPYAYIVLSLEIQLSRFFIVGTWKFTYFLESDCLFLFMRKIKSNLMQTLLNKEVKLYKTLVRKKLSRDIAPSKHNKNNDSMARCSTKFSQLDRQVNGKAKASETPSFSPSIIALCKRLHVCANADSLSQLSSFQKKHSE